MRPLLLATLLAATPALAADHELSFEIGTLTTSDGSFDRFAADGTTLGMGLRAAFAATEHLAVHVGWHHTRTGATLYAFSPDDDTSETLGRAAWFGNEIYAGPRFDWPLWGFFVPYAHVDGVFLIADARLDDDPSDPHSPGQTRQMGFSAGARGMGGVELQLPRRDGQWVTGGLYLEAGYTWLSPTKLGDLGDAHLYGFTFRSGIGVRL